MPSNSGATWFDDFVPGVHDLNNFAADGQLNAERRGKLKEASTFVYDIAASVAAKGDIWNWGMHDPALADELETMVPGCLSFNTDGVSEQLYYRTLKRLLLGTDDYHGRTVLEVGCGMGEGLSFLSRLFPTTRFIGLDLSPSQSGAPTPC